MSSVPEWAWEFHGHQCPFMPLGFRMGKLAMKELGAEHEKDHGFFVIPELGIGHPQTCLMDGIQIATGILLLLYYTPSIEAAHESVGRPPRTIRQDGADERAGVGRAAVVAPGKVTEVLCHVLAGAVEDVAVGEFRECRLAGAVVGKRFARLRGLLREVRGRIMRYPL